MKPNNRFQILTPSGWCNFEGLQKTVHTSCIDVKTNTDTNFRCSLEHLVQLQSGEFVPAKQLSVGLFLFPNSKITSLTHIEDSIDLYDPINVDNDEHSYFADSHIHHNCSFEGSSYTLIDGIKLASIPIIRPIYDKDGLEIFEEPDKDRSYVITVDVSRGQHMDYSAFSITDITQMPYKIVATYKNNQITTLEYPHLLFNMARQYNNAFLLIEINDLGEEVSNIIWYEYEYENVYFTHKSELIQSRGYPGIRTTSKVKGLGCSVLKELIEKDQLIINSHKIIEELGLFVVHRKSYASQDPSVNDDLCTTLWLLAWLTKQDIFQQINNNNLRHILTEKKQQFINDCMTPFGFYQDSKLAEPNRIAKDNWKLPSKESPLHLTTDQIELLKM